MDNEINLGTKNRESRDNEDGSNLSDLPKTDNDLDYSDNPITSDHSNAQKATNEQPNHELLQQILDIASVTEQTLRNINLQLEENNVRIKYKDEAIARMQAQIADFEKDILRSVKGSMVKDVILFYDSLQQFFKKFQNEFDKVEDCTHQYSLVLEELIELLFRQDIELLESQVINGDQFINREFQKPVKLKSTNIPEDNGKVVEKIRDGFRWGDKILRKQEVTVKKYIIEEK